MHHLNFMFSPPPVTTGNQNCKVYNYINYIPSRRESDILPVCTHQFREDIWDMFLYIPVLVSFYRVSYLYRLATLRCSTGCICMSLPVHDGFCVHCPFLSQVMNPPPV